MHSAAASGPGSPEITGPLAAGARQRSRSARGQERATGPVQRPESDQGGQGAVGVGAAARPPTVPARPLLGPEGRPRCPTDHGRLRSIPFRTAAGDAIEVRVVIRRSSAEDDARLEGRAGVDLASGIKVWEGGLDLAEALAALPREAAGHLRGGRALELGAGHGVPGIVASMHLGMKVDFHDHSAEVLEQVTAANAAASGLGEATSPPEDPPRLLSGDWRELLREVSQGAYDVVLAAEAIYRTDMYDDLAALLERCLTPTGVAWFAGKRLYFGCGGGTASFGAFMRARGGFTVDTAQVIEDGRSNLREILKISRTRSDACAGAKAAVEPAGGGQLSS
ncbi:unnamed protein product [Prorocentrum cordatum]|uniref:protein-histidine N-methyltransferase n=1 Tax=Prorocentrum cordatum TaxID=2364126 RepID=A0ABN9WVF6_9DINO|nr:unnamed protein product [Polarella glacialis]